MKRPEDVPTDVIARMEITAGATRWYADEWEAFLKLCEKREMKPTDQIRRLVRDLLADRYFSLSGVKPEILAELEDYADTLGVTTQTAAERILTDFLAPRRRERGTKRK